MVFMLENLEVYQKAVNLADQVATMTEGFPRGYYFLVDQLNRAALSVATNLAEGNGRFTKALAASKYLLALYVDAKVGEFGPLALKMESYEVRHFEARG